MRKISQPLVLIVLGVCGKAHQESPPAMTFPLSKASRPCRESLQAVGPALVAVREAGGRPPLQHFIAHSQGYRFLCEGVISFLCCGAGWEEGTQSDGLWGCWGQVAPQPDPDPLHQPQAPHSEGC